MSTKKSVLDDSTKDYRMILPEKHVENLGEASHGEEDQDGLALLVDAGTTQVVHPAPQHLLAFIVTQPHLREGKSNGLEVGFLCTATVPPSNLLIINQILPI